MVNLQIRIDNELKDQAQKVANDLGMDLTTAVRIFLKQMVTDRALPFRPELDQFYSPSNISVINQSIAELESGKTITKIFAELEEMAK